MKKYYEILGLNQGASISEIESAYNKLSNKIDLKNAATDDLVKHQAIKRAYQILTRDGGNKEIYNFPKTKKTGINKWLIVLFLGVVFFGIPYIIFQNKVSELEDVVPLIEKKNLNYRDSELIHWQSKFFKDRPEIVNKHKNDGTNQGFLFEIDNSIVFKDSVVKFFLFKKTIPILNYKLDFFKCVYYNSLNSDNFWMYYTVKLKNRYRENSSDLPYFSMRKYLKNKHRISNNDYQFYLDKVGGIKVFFNEKQTSFDMYCKTCLEDYTAFYETNNVAVKEFYDFVDVFIKNKRQVVRDNKKTISSYNKQYSKLTQGMSSNLISKLETKIKQTPILSKTTDSREFNGTKKGIGLIDYYFQIDSYNSTNLEKLSNEIYIDFYKTNSLRTGSKPYAYCYGSNPYCSPPNGYVECSFIDVRASSSSDVIVIIKKNNRVYSHAYIKAGGYYKFKLGNGNFQTFFYYGNGWNPNKFIKNAICGKITGGFVSDESLDKSELINLRNSSMTYTLYSVNNGNFQPKSSNKNEAF